MSRARPLSRELTAQEKIRRRRVLRTRWPGIYEVIGSDGRTRYRILAREGLCRCKGGSQPFRCWHAKAVRQRVREESMTDNPSPPAEAGESPPPDPGGEKPRRRRRTKAEIEAAAEAEAERSRLASLPADLPPFHPSISDGRVTATAERTVRTGQYESYTARVHLDFERDPRFSVVENAGMLADAAGQEVNRVCDLVQSQIQVEK